jgi:hypothetical protein
MSAFEYSKIAASEFRVSDNIPKMELEGGSWAMKKKNTRPDVI